MNNTSPLLYVILAFIGIFLVFAAIISCIKYYMAFESFQHGDYASAASIMSSDRPYYGYR